MLSVNRETKTNSENIVITLSFDLLKELRWLHEDKVTVKVAPDGSAIRLERSKTGYMISRHGGKKNLGISGTVKMKGTRVPWLKLTERTVVQRDQIEVDAAGFTALLK